MGQYDIESLIEAAGELADAAGDEADNLLWCCSAFPAVPWGHCLAQLRQLAAQTAGRYGAAMELAHREIRATHQRAKAAGLFNPRP
jgi:hypothetical protein